MQKSNLLEIYKKSPFANLGNKVTSMQTKKIPGNINIEKYNTKSILEVQKDFTKLVVLPYKTLMEQHSKIGDISVNPTTPILSLFSSVNNSISQVAISSGTDLLKMTSIYSNIKPLENSLSLQYKELPSLGGQKETSILSNKIPEINISSVKNDLLGSDLPSVSNFITGDILKLNSSFSDIVEFKTKSILDNETSFGEITELPYSNILDLKTQYNDLVIKDINSVLKVYMASNLPGTIPGIANFIEDIHATGFTLNAKQGNTFFNLNNLPEATRLQPTPEKTGIDIKLANENPEKTSIDIKLPDETPEKLPIDIKLFNETPEKTGIEISIPDNTTPTKQGIEIKAANITPEKEGIEIVGMSQTPEKTGIDITPMRETPEKQAIEILQPDNILADKPTLEINEMPSTPDKTTIEIIPMSEGEEKKPLNIQPMRETAEKEVGTIKLMNETPDKQGLDINLMPNTPNKDVGNIRLMPETPEKSVGTIVPMQQTPEKEVGDIRLMPDTPEKSGLDVFDGTNVPEKIGTDVNPMPDPIEKPIGDINPPAETLDKPIPNLVPMADTPEKKGLDVNLMPATGEKPYSNVFDGTNVPEKVGMDVYDETDVPEKIGIDVFDNTNVPEKIGIDVYDGTNVPNKLHLLREINLIPIGDRTLISNYYLDKVPDIYGFNWNIPPAYPGVLNQYAVYFSKYPPLTNVTYKTVIDWAYNRIIRVPPAQELYNQGFHTPKVPASQVQSIIPPYKYANDRLPLWANTYSNTLADMGSTLVAGYLSQKTIDLLGTITDLDASPMKQSKLAFHQLAGEIYWKHSELGTKIRNVREGILNYTSNLVGHTLANVFIPKVESYIGGLTANLVNTTLNAAVLNDEKVLMLYHIMMGTKYTKSKAFFDKLAKTYSSYEKIGDNAVNLYNDSNTYKKYADGNSVNAFGYSIPSLPGPVSTQVSVEGGGLLVSGESDQDNSVSALKSTLSRVVKGRNNFLIPIGKYQSGLMNRYIWKNDSWTFGQQVESEKYYPVDVSLEQRVHQYDEQVMYSSIDKNYPTQEQINENPSLEPKTDLNALADKSISNYSSVLSSDLYVAKNNISSKSTKENSYLSLMKNRLFEAGKLLDDRGFPSIKTDFSDAKNRLGMIKMPPKQENVLGTEEYKDNDLIDFYFEDISTLSNTHESIVIPFRAILSAVTDGTSANWASQDYMGRADKFWIYQGFERRVAVQFDVAINSKDEFISTWNKINYLHGMCYPVEYPAEISLKAPIMSLTIGDLFNRIQVILNSFNVSFDGSTLWETEQGYQLPMYIKIQTDMTVLFDDLPIASQKRYAQQNNWMTPKVYDYNEFNSQNEQNQNILALNSSGSIDNIKRTDFVNVLQNLGTQTFGLGR